MKEVETNNSASHAARSVEVAAPDVAVSSPAGFDAWRSVHRALRGRYRLTIAIASLMTVIGFSVGWEWVGLLYRSDGMVRIASALPPVVKQTDQNQPIPMFDSFIQAQQELITSRSVLEDAMRDEIWNTPSVAGGRLSVSELAAGLKVEVRGKSENLRISFTDTNPAISIAAVRSTIAAYQNAYMRDHAEREQRRQRLLEDYRASLVKQLEVAMADPVALPRAALSPSTQPVDAQQKVEPVKPRRPNPYQLAMTDPEMRRLLDEHVRAADQIDRERISYGDEHPTMLRLKKELDQADRRIARHIDEMYAIQLARYDAQFQAFHSPDLAQAIEPPAAQTVPSSPAINQLRSEIEDVTKRLEILKTEAAMPKRFEVVKTGDFPVAVPDRRIKTAIMGGAAGGGMALAAMVLAGMLRRTYLYCADVVDDLASHAPYVAAIPDITPMNRSHASDAVQCVHQIRQTLEHDGRIYLVSSSAWGSGQTSVLMSLAMSFAASGVKTLVIDADTTSRGLSMAMKMDKDVGFADVLDGCELDFCVKTNTHGLHILPAGLTAGEGGADIQQTQLKQLLDRARLQFEIVLIDAAPVLASADTHLLARSVDGVLLAISRGQARKPIARTLRDLAQARVAVIGAVFNRVMAADFDQSIPKRTKTLASASTYKVAQEWKDLGPLVDAMATSVRTPATFKRLIDIKALNRPNIDFDQQAAESIAA